MKQYTDILREILRRGRRKVNRTGVETLSIIGPSMTFYMDDGFPLETLRPIFFKGIKEENLWFIDGRCNNEALLAKGVQIWNSWALPEAITQNAFRALPDVVADYVAYRQKLLAESEAKLVVESGDASVISEQPAYTFEDAVRELTLADQKAMDEGKPVVGKPLGAQTHEELMGGHEILRNAGIPMTEERVLMPKGYLGPIYGVLWRGWIDHTGRRIDQLANVLAKLASDNPKLRYSRSNIITSYNPAVLPDETKSAQENILDGKQALAACHTMFQLLAEPMTLEERVAWHNRKVDEARDIHGDQVGADFEQVRWNYVSVESLWTLSSIPAQDFDEEAGHGVMDKLDCPRDQLSLVLYQRKYNCALAA